MIKEVSIPKVGSLLKTYSFSRDFLTKEYKYDIVTKIVFCDLKEQNIPIGFYTIESNKTPFPIDFNKTNSYKIIVL